MSETRASTRAEAVDLVNGSLRWAAERLAEAHQHDPAVHKKAMKHARRFQNHAPVPMSDLRVAPPPATDPPPFWPVKLTGHALARYEQASGHRYPTTSQWALLDLARANEEPAELIGALTRAPRRGSEGERYVVSPCRSGCWVIVPEGDDIYRSVAVTYLRFSETQRQLLDREPTR